MHEWFEDYAAFVKLYGIQADINTIHCAGDINGKNLYLGWVTGGKEYLER